jgi:hypothetical protein
MELSCFAFLGLHYVIPDPSVPDIRSPDDPQTETR